MSNNATNTSKQMTWASNAVMSQYNSPSWLVMRATTGIGVMGSFTLPSAWGAGETNATTVTASLLAGNDTSADVALDTVALDWHNISCSIYKVGPPVTAQAVLSDSVCASVRHLISTVLVALNCTGQFRAQCW